MRCVWSKKVVAKTANDDPIYEACSNLLMDAIRPSKVCTVIMARNVVFASSKGTAYGVPEAFAIDENYQIVPVWWAASLPTGS